ncbi:uncharacterized protein EV422DRAFT_240927 [Fimicolochytrium jonesii]|uniref:uncharacterized protein n=1 Tax=Fimicolochytrium jonesii TaxID=1396493 RepID=UPI0022FE474C|nr:uncharacterized protein EV422DRAFT_240927 [Fimicolochytrium jonesii]KAI8825001.1 hypothetical protein EV422DRAFT_240927 [Fimicolochytrium jonesii]
MSGKSEEPAVAPGPLPDFSHCTIKNEWTFTDYQVLFDNPATRKDPVKWVPKVAIWQNHQMAMLMDKVSVEGDFRVNEKLTMKGLALDAELLDAAKILMHRFFMTRPMQDTHRWEICATLIYMVGKLAELPQFKRVEHVAQVFAAALVKAIPRREDIDIWVKRMIFNEIEIMASVGADLWPDLPHGRARKLIKTYGGSKELRESVEKCCSDALITTLAIRASPDEIAQGAVLLACFKTKTKLLVGEKRWYQEEGLDKHRLDVIAQEISNARHMQKTMDFIEQRTKQIQAPLVQEHSQVKATQKDSIKPKEAVRRKSGSELAVEKNVANSNKEENIIVRKRGAGDDVEPGEIEEEEVRPPSRKVARRTQQSQPNTKPTLPSPTSPAPTHRHRDAHRDNRDHRQHPYRRSNHGRGRRNSRASLSPPPKDVRRVSLEDLKRERPETKVTPSKTEPSTPIRKVALLEVPSETPAEGAASPDKGRNHRSYAARRPSLRHNPIRRPSK